MSTLPVIRTAIAASVAASTTRNGDVGDFYRGDRAAALGGGRHDRPSGATESWRCGRSSSRRKEQLDQITTDHPGIETVVLDVTDPTSIANARETVTSIYPKVNVLVNNAGIQLPENLLDAASLRVAEDTVSTNLLGPIRMTYAFVQHLVAKDDAVIINVSSGLAFVPLPLTPTYNATKAAIHSFSESLRVQLADAGVQVIELVPPPVRTTLMGQQDRAEAMPLEDFLSEVMSLLRAQPDAREILVENVKLLRNAAADGSYDNFLAMLSAYGR